MSRLVLCLLVFLLAACRGPRERAVERLNSVGPDRLRHDAALLYRELFNTRGMDFVVIRPMDWPPSFKAIAPIRIGAYPDGISLATYSRNDVESGLYIVPQSMDHEPGNVRGGHFEKVAEGIYWYSFGN
jgi:hypothetical protein